MAVTDWNQLPVVMGWEDAGRVVDCHSYDAVRRAIKSGRLPAPDYTNPMQWSRAELMRHFHFPVVELAARQN